MILFVRAACAFVRSLSLSHTLVIFVAHCAWEDGCVCDYISHIHSYLWRRRKQMNCNKSELRWDTLYQFSCCLLFIIICPMSHVTFDNEIQKFLWCIFCVFCFSLSLSFFLIIYIFVCTSQSICFLLFESFAFLSKVPSHWVLFRTKMFAIWKWTRTWIVTRFSTIWIIGHFS